MRKNIFIKSMLRQPIRTALLMVLIGLSSFAFFLRTAEFITVRSEINELSQLYRAIGFLRAESPWDDVSDAAAILRESPFVRQAESRMAVEATLLDFHNTDVIGMVRGIPENMQTRITESLFYATVLDMIPMQHAIRLDLLLIERLAGYSEHLTNPWRTLQMDFEFNMGVDADALKGLTIGQTYIFRGVYYQRFGALMLHVPRRSENNNPIQMRPLNNDGLWFYPVEDVRAGVDFSSAHLKHIADDVAFLNHHHHGVLMTGTIDMTAMPFVQRNASLPLGLREQMRYIIQLHQGRLITYDDHIHENHVVVVSHAFARANNLHVGHELRLRVSSEQHVVGFSPISREFVVRSHPDAAHKHYLELEIVGIISDFSRSLGIGSVGNTFLYVPASIIPDDVHFIIDDPMIQAAWHDGFIPSMRYSFILEDARHEQEFILQYADTFSDMNMALVVFESGASEFWEAVSPLLLIVVFNAVVFWVVLILVLSLVVYIYLKQRWKDMAVQRALGGTKYMVASRLSSSVLFFCMPSVLIGGYVGWLFSLDTIYRTLVPIGDIVAGYTPQVTFSVYWFVIMVLIVFVFIMVLIIIGLVRASRISVLALLQGTMIKKRKQKTTIDTTVVITQEPLQVKNLKMPVTKLVGTGMMRIINFFMYVFRVVSRTPMKTLLGIFIALFSILVLGWLQESIHRADENIGNLYRSTIVFGEVRQADPFAVNATMFDSISRRAVDDVRESGLVDNLFLESMHFMSFIVMPDHNGAFPYDWQERIGYHAQLPVRHPQNIEQLDFLFSFNDYALFMKEYSFDGYGGLEIIFKTGYTENNFIFFDSMRIPIIVADAVMDARGFFLGDDVFVGYMLNSPHDLQYIPARIIGTHNGMVTREEVRNSVFIPQSVMEDVLGGLAFYSTLRFNINPVYNTNIQYVRKVLEEIASARRAGLLPMELILMDRIMLNLVSIARQTLLLLEMVYPLALIVTVVISAGLALLLALQNAKIAAIQHILGQSKRRIMTMLFAEQMTVCLMGVIPGFLILLLMHVYLGSLFFLAMGLYFGCVVVGNVVGAWIVIRRKPLELLQVKE